jgi:hypothetical protein
MVTKDIPQTLKSPGQPLTNWSEVVARGLKAKVPKRSPAKRSKWNDTALVMVRQWSTLNTKVKHYTCHT